MVQFCSKFIHSVIPVAFFFIIIISVCNIRRVFIKE